MSHPTTKNPENAAVWPIVVGVRVSQSTAERLARVALENGLKPGTYARHVLLQALRAAEAPRAA